MLNRKDTIKQICPSFAFALFVLSFFSRIITFTMDESNCRTAAGIISAALLWLCHLRLAYVWGRGRSQISMQQKMADTLLALCTTIVVVWVWWPFSGFYSIGVCWALGVGFMQGLPDRWRHIWELILAIACLLLAFAAFIFLWWLLARLGVPAIATD